MSRLEYLQRKIRRGSARRRKIVTGIALGAAVLLVLSLSIAKIYSVVMNGKQGGTGDQAAGGIPASASQAAVSTGTVEAAVAPVAPVSVTAPAPAAKNKAVALTFDDGPSRANTGTILDVLKQYGAHATFFVLGDRARVDGDILQMELAAGCEIGSHSWNHPQLSKMKWSGVKNQVNKTDQIVKKLADGYKIKLLRPPYGAISNTMRRKLKKPMILWSLDTLDWKYRNAKKVFRKVKKEVKDGDIILMHDIHEETAEAIKLVVPWLANHGYDILTVSELAERNGKKLEAGKAYCDGKK